MVREEHDQIVNQFGTRGARLLITVTSTIHKHTHTNIYIYIYIYKHSQLTSVPQQFSSIPPPPPTPHSYSNSIFLGIGAEFSGFWLSPELRALPLDSMPNMLIVIAQSNYTLV